MPLRRAVWALALPAFATHLVRFANFIVDQYWVGRLTDPQVGLAAVSASNFLIWSTFALSQLFTAGLQAKVARAVGAGDTHEQAVAIRHGMALALSIGTGVAVAGLLLMPHVFAWQHLSPPVAKAASEFLTITFAVLPVNFVAAAMITIYNAEGDPSTPLKVFCIGLVINSLLDPPFILGWGPIPAMGVKGSALVTAMVVVTHTLVLGLLHRRKMADRLSVEFHPRECLPFLRLGLPVAAAGLLFSSVYVFLVRILAPFGDAPVAALGLGHTIEGLAHFLCVGFGMAAATLVGQNLGAGRPEQARQAAWAAVGQLSLALGFVALGYGLNAPHLLALFMANPQAGVIAAGSDYLHMAAWVQVPGGLRVVLNSAMVGAGDTVAPTVSLVCTLLRIPLAFALAQRLGLGPRGVWLSIGATVLIEAAMMSWLFARGRWQARRV
ncbi:MAG: MATE family efflux transporter [Armatimonadetes bacterium]|nr:MATE family efflux transporter [Armatimonadota bacterium]